MFDFSEGLSQVIDSAFSTSKFVGSRKLNRAGSLGLCSVKQAPAEPSRTVGVASPIARA